MFSLQDSLEFGARPPTEEGLFLLKTTATFGSSDPCFGSVSTRSNLSPFFRLAHSSGHKTGLKQPPPHTGPLSTYQTNYIRQQNGVSPAILALAGPSTARVHQQQTTRCRRDQDRSLRLVGSSSSALRDNKIRVLSILSHLPRPS